ncbi:Uncharacterised protein [[Pasteurella] mairii]|uniref:Lipoprotein n=1 Tax=[Pasteurella] mairii TaxID=757 RepID=A0A379B3R8_9PAST|nr:Uncharacterised protein [[Pasteurella] mairii]
MKKFILLSSLLLVGCYLANGSPFSTNYWVKQGEIITYNDQTFCHKKVYGSFDHRFNYLDNLFWNNKLSSIEYEEYSQYLRIAKQMLSQCYFDLGYRFTAPYYWCIAERNMETCKINQKYR